MPGPRSTPALPIVLFVLVASICTAGVCQGLGPEMYGIPGSFGMGAPTPTREMAMGVILSCVNDHQYANPAFAAAQQKPSAGIRLNTTSFDRGPALRSTMAQFSLPLRANETGMQLTLLTMNGSGGNAQMPLIGGINTRMTENAWVVDYGRRLRPRFTAGLSILGRENVGFNLTSPLPFVGTLIDINDKADFGARVGATYELQPGSYLGCVYSYSQDTIDATIGTLSGPVSMHTVYHNNQLALGVSRQFSPQLLGALEFQRGTTWRFPFSSSDNAWHLGAEYKPNSACAIRAGLADGHPTFGIGYDGSRWSADYAYLKDWNAAAVAPLFGGSKTHSLQVAYRW